MGWKLKSSFPLARLGKLGAGVKIAYYGSDFPINLAPPSPAPQNWQSIALTSFHHIWHGYIYRLPVLPVVVTSFWMYFLFHFFCFSLNQHFKKHNINLRQYWLKHLKPPHMSLAPMMNGMARGGGVPAMRGGRGGGMWGRGAARGGVAMAVSSGSLRLVWFLETIQ